jgi:hypothetical protein
MAYYQRTWLSSPPPPKALSVSSEAAGGLPFGMVQIQIQIQIIYCRNIIIRLQGLLIWYITHSET